MTTFVLLHGAWHGGWCWKRVSDRLRELGYGVFSPTFSGLSDRSHVLSPQTSLRTHVEDIVRLIDAEGLTDAVIVGHSYAGMVAAGVAELRPEATRLRVHLDAFLPVDGEAAVELLPQEVANHYRDSVAQAGFGWLIPPRSLEVLGVTDPNDLGWLRPRLTPQPWATYTEAIALGQNERDVPGVYIECTSWIRVFTPQADRARDRGWPVHELDSGHEAMVTAPAQLAALLHTISNESR